MSFPANPESRHPEPGVVVIPSVNWQGLKTLYLKEVRRFFKVQLQTIWAPAITTLLFLVIFALALGGTRTAVLGVRYADFLGPGLIVMGMIQCMLPLARRLVPSANPNAALWENEVDEYHTATDRYAIRQLCDSDMFTDGLDDYNNKHAAAYLNAPGGWALHSSHQQQERHTALVADSGPARYYQHN